MTMNNVLFHMLPPCCNLAAVPVQILAKREGKFFASFMPDAVTAIVVTHHVVTEEEWTWYSTVSSGERCDADDHLRDLCEAIREQLVKQGYHAKLVKYPGESGLRFRFVAEVAGLGRIGTNAFLFHPRGVLGFISGSWEQPPNWMCGRSCLATNSVTRAVFAFPSVPLTRYRKTLFEDSDADHTERPGENMNHTVQRASYHTASGAFVFVRRGSNQYHV